MVDIYSPEGIAIRVPEPPPEAPEFSVSQIDQMIRDSYVTYWGEEEGERQFKSLEVRRNQPRDKKRKPKEAMQIETVAVDATMAEPPQAEPTGDQTPLYYDTDFRLSLEEIPVFAALSPEHKRRVHFFITEGGTPPEDLPVVINYLAEILDEKRKGNQAA